MRLLQIKRFPGYSVSDQGWIESNSRFTTSQGRPKKVSSRILKSAISGSGYAFVTLRKDNKAYNVRIHKAVAEAFIGPIPKGLIVHHKDGNKTNNKYDNLEYTSKQKNTQKYYQSLGKSIGSIPLESIPSIINRVNNGEQCYLIAKEFNVRRNDIAVLCKVVALTGKELTLTI
jgi:hypothetical protein